MRRFRRLSLLLFLAAFVGLCGAGQAAQIHTYDLDSLCYMSTDVVEATLIWHPKTGLGAQVVASIAGQFHPGDQIAPLHLELFDPNAVGQRCFLFIERREYTRNLQPEPDIAPRVADMLLIDGQGHVRRYFQWGDPGGLVAEGYFPHGIRGADRKSYPTVAEERAVLVSHWAEVDALRSLLSHEPRPEDISVLLKLLRERRTLREHRRNFHDVFHFLEDGLAEVVCSRLADLGDPAVALDALAADPDPYAEELSGICETPFRWPASIDYARSVLTDPGAYVDRRLAAADVLEYADSRPDAPLPQRQADRAATTTIALADDAPEPLRMALIPRLDLKRLETADALRHSYHQTSSEELRFAIEKAFACEPSHPPDRQYISLNSPSGPVLSIVRRSFDLPVKPGFVGLMPEIILTGATEGVELSRGYVFTNTASGKVFRVHMEDRIVYGWFGDEQVPLPKGLPPGRYRIAQEFRTPFRLVSTGHSVTLPLPPPKKL